MDIFIFVHSKNTKIIQQKNTKGLHIKMEKGAKEEYSTCENVWTATFHNFHKFLKKKCGMVANKQEVACKI